MLMQAAARQKDMIFTLRTELNRVKTEHPEVQVQVHHVMTEHHKPIFSNTEVQTESSSSSEGVQTIPVLVETANMQTDKIQPTSFDERRNSQPQSETCVQTEPQQVASLASMRETDIQTDEFEIIERKDVNLETQDVAIQTETHQSSTSMLEVSEAKLQAQIDANHDMGRKLESLREQLKAAQRNAETAQARAQDVEAEREQILEEFRRQWRSAQEKAEAAEHAAMQEQEERQAELAEISELRKRLQQLEQQPLQDNSNVQILELKQCLAAEQERSAQTQNNLQAEVAQLQNQLAELAQTQSEALNKTTDLQAAYQVDSTSTRLDSAENAKLRQELEKKEAKLEGLKEKVSKWRSEATSQRERALTLEREVEFLRSHLLFEGDASEKGSAPIEDDHLDVDDAFITSTIVQ